MGRNWSRRQVAGALAASAAGLCLPVWVWQRRQPMIPEGPRVGAAFAPDAFLRLEPSGVVTVETGATEMGQGIHTALGLIVAEALDLEWRMLRVRTATEHAAYHNRLMGGQITIGSSSVRAWHRPLRAASGRARAMLLAAAAREWGVKADQCTTSAGKVIHPDGARKLTYGELAERAGQLDPKSYRATPAMTGRFVGRGAPRLDLVANTTGRSAFGGDVRLPEMLFASVEQIPAGAKLDQIDEEAARGTPGVKKVLRTSFGVGVLASDTWSAMQGRRALKASSIQGSVVPTGTRERYQDLARAADAAPGGADRRVVEAEYWLPLLAHAAIEPVNCTAVVRDGRCEVWLPTQAQTSAQTAAMRASGLPGDSVIIHTTAVGGAFGRKVDSTVVTEAVTLAQLAGAPVQLLWTREDDFRRDRFRPCSAHHLRAAIEPGGRIVQWHHRNVGDGTAGTPPPYRMADVRLEQVPGDPGVSTGIWRGIDHVANAFVIETMIDELATMAESDPLEFRLRLLRPSSRLAKLLTTLKRDGSWRPGASNPVLGLAAHEMCGSAVATVVEVDSYGASWRVSKVTTAVDCGQVIDPDGVRAQVEGSIAMGLSACLHEEVVVQDGRLETLNFDTYRVLRAAEMPEVRVILDSTGKEPGGIGEVAVPTIAPAVANAYFQLSHERLRVMPFLPEK